MEEATERPMPKGSQHVPAAYVVTGAMVLLALAAFAWRYYLERTACFDSAFFSWLMIDEGVPVSVLGRYGSWVAQLLPVFLIKLGASLQGVLRAYSIAFILFHALVFYLLAFRLKDMQATLVLPMVLTAGFHYMFYYGISELYQGLSLMVLLWVLIRRAFDPVGPSPRRWMMLAFLVNAWASFYHQLLVLPLLFILVFEAIPNAWRQRRSWFFGLALVVWYVIRIKGMSASSYEEARMPTLADLATHIVHLGDLNSTIYFLMVWTKFKAMLLLIVAAGALAIYARAWLRLAWCAVFSIAFLVLILIVDRDGMAPVIYENYYPVFGLVWAILFATVVESLQGRLRQGALFVLVAVCGLGLLQIHRGHYRLTDRVEYVQRITAYKAQQGVRKSMVRFDNYPWSYGLVHWAVGMESALCSGVNGPTRAATIFVSDKVALLDSVASHTEQFLGPDWQPLWFGLQNLDHRFFDFPTDVGYAWANTTDTFPDPPALTIQCPASPYRMVPDRFTVVPIELRNEGTLRMPSRGARGKPLQFIYTLLRTDGTVYQESAIRSSMEVDVAPGTTYKQGLVVERPVDNGRFVVRAWLTDEGVELGDAVQFEIDADAWPL
ncbi:MAG TPA: hypothetical protein PLS30_00825 [Flavobacteriales bacterium]|jgi:hypothetical protein|nr:hypothetical protein [Flavobacteriales bacterium]MCC6911855.1 hypothetical protein [Flavobacteriales bacterium]HQW97468.1 hypothetical protein [Flavobacteriales bacterium]